VDVDPGRSGGGAAAAERGRGGCPAALRGAGRGETVLRRRRHRRLKAAESDAVAVAADTDAGAGHRGYGLERGERVATRAVAGVDGRAGWTHPLAALRAERGVGLGLARICFHIKVVCCS